MRLNQLCTAAGRPLRAALCGLLCVQGAAAQEAAAPALPCPKSRCAASCRPRPWRRPPPP